MIIAVDAGALPLPLGLDLQPAVNVFNNPTHPDVMVLTGIACDDWQETSSGVLLAGTGWNIYPMKQFGNGPYMAERDKAGWITGAGRVDHTALEIPVPIPTPAASYSLTDAYDGTDLWLRLSRTAIDGPDAEMNFQYSRGNHELSFAWTGDLTLSNGECIVNGGAESDVLGELGCDLHSTLALRLSEENIRTTWTQTI